MERQHLFESPAEPLAAYSEQLNEWLLPLQLLFHFQDTDRRFQDGIGV